MSIQLGVNIDHVATLRQMRGTAYPDLMQAAAICEQAGAYGITIHLREDRRHIQDADVYALRKAIKTRLNLEMANNPDVLAIALDIVPDEICMVPERREELTTEDGLNVSGQKDKLAPTIDALKAKGICVSLFINPDEKQIACAAELGAQVIELHTGTYATEFDAGQTAEFERIRTAAAYAASLGLQVNAGHGLSIYNLRPLLALPQLHTLNIGHSIVCEAVFKGLDGAVREMLETIAKGVS